MPYHESYKNKSGKMIDLKVIVYTRPNLRGGETEMMMYMGKTYLDNIFDECKISERETSLHFEWPERWTNICEQRALLTRIPLVYPNVKTVTIKTHSVYIIQCTHREQIGIVDDPTKFPEHKYDDLTVKYAPSPSQMNGLMVFHA